MSINEDNHMRRGELDQSLLEQVTGKWDVRDFERSNLNSNIYYDEKYIIIDDETVFDQWVYRYQYEHLKPEMIRFNGKFIAIYSSDIHDISEDLVRLKTRNSQENYDKNS